MAKSDFYMTCATVIPVLFIALVVPGGTFDTMLSTAMRAARREPLRQRDGMASAWLPGLAWIIVMCAALGEIFCVLILFTGSSDGGGGLVLAMTIVLALRRPPGPL